MRGKLATQTEKKLEGGSNYENNKESKTEISVNKFRQEL
jgi:hypothetical protein